jgi:hypothetical protein
MERGFFVVRFGIFVFFLAFFLLVLVREFFVVGGGRRSGFFWGFGFGEIFFFGFKGINYNEGY